jgi:hypothetical protein
MAPNVVWLLIILLTRAHFDSCGYAKYMPIPRIPPLSVMPTTMSYLYIPALIAYQYRIDDDAH